MKKQIVFHLILAIFPAGLLLSQDNTPFYANNHQPQNAWYIELGGSSLVGVTFNYERFLSKKPGGLSLRAGIGGGVVFFFENIAFAAFPVGMSYNIPVSKNKNHFIEIGGTYTTLLAQGENVNFFAGILGWRYDAKPKGVHLRASLIPIVYSPIDKGSFGPWAGFSIGKRF